MAVVWEDFHRKVGLWGGAMCTASLSPHLISPLSLFFFPPSLSLRPSPYLTLPAGTKEHTHKRMSQYTLTQTLSLLLIL